MLNIIENFMLNNKFALYFRDRMGDLVSPYIALTNKTFSKDFRHGVSIRHRIVYAFLDTIQANNSAWKLRRRFTKGS